MIAHADLQTYEARTVLHLGITIDPSRDDLLTPFGKITMKGQFCLPHETYQEAFARAAVAFSGEDLELAQRLYDYASLQWFSFASPLLANGGTNRGLPISCFLNHVDDSIQGLAENFRENAFLSTNGGGIGTYWGAVRSLGEVTSKGVDTPGAMAFMHVQDAQVLAYHQGSTRRGAAATYMDVSHPEIRSFVTMRMASGDSSTRNENLHHGVCISDEFMIAVRDGLPWDLIDPHSGRVHETTDARALWGLILQTRVAKGEPYLFFTDTANRCMPKALRDLGLKIHHSNLCTEITLPTSPDRTAVCCLSSINVAKIDEWWESRVQFIDDLMTMLDNTLDVFIEMAPQPMWRAVNSATSERSVGLGTLGFHTYLQDQGIPMDSPEAEAFNTKLYSTLNVLTEQASRRLAVERGEAPDMVGTGLRHAHRLAIAPNATSSIICGGVSPSCEPMAANAFVQKTMVGSQQVRNPALARRLEALGLNNEDIWRSIMLNQGSVQHLEELSDHDKQVFRTASETDPMTLIKLGGDRQLWLCQAQSVNLFMPPDPTTKELHEAHFAAWKLGLKSLYYLRSSSVRATSVGDASSATKLTAAPTPAPEPEGQVCDLSSDCLSCQG